MITDAKEAQRRLSEGGRKGGSAEVPKGFAKMPKKKLKQIARRAAAARWPNGAAK